MTGICSKHQTPASDCVLCNTDIRDVLPDYDKKIAEAEAAGRHTCVCGFEYFLTTDACPRCGRQNYCEIGHDGN
jgi:hypothetical protein